MSAETQKRKDAYNQKIQQSWNRWLFTDDGINSAKIENLPRDTNWYLKNRLWLAFQAGVKAAQSAAAPNIAIVNSET